MRHRAFASALVASALLLSTSPARAADDDPWWGRDKALHFGVSAGLAAGGYAAGTAIFESRGGGLLLGGGVAFGAGVLKETLDLAGFGTPSWKDLAWDGIGVVTGLALAWSLDLAIRGVSSERPLVARQGLALSF